MDSHQKKQGGQAAIMVTLALIAMCGVLGLAVDMGWSYFVKKSAQAAADAAALAAVNAAQKLGFHPPFTCGNTAGQIYCTGGAPTSCGDPAVAGNLDSACVYAALNGFTQGGRVNVTVAAALGPTAPTVPGVAVEYWVTVRVNQQVPQLFSAVLGNTSGLVSARATAALTNVIFNASLDLLNRENDPNPLMGTGANLNIQGGGNVSAPGGMLVASTGPVPNGTPAVKLGGNALVSNTPYALFRGALGSCIGNGGSNCSASDWQTQLPTYGVGDGNTFMDPTSLGKERTQPPLDISSNALTPRPVPGGDLSSVAVSGDGSSRSPFILPPGVYYASVSSTNPAATGAQLQFTGANNNYQFSNTCAGCTTTSSNFGQYIFFGGLATGAGNQTITMAAGRYVLAGTTGNRNQFDISNGTTLLDGNTGIAQTTAGEWFIYTDGRYNWAASATPDGVTSWPAGGLSSMPLPSALQSYGITNFQFGQGGFTYQGGNNNNTLVQMAGLNPSGTNVPANLTNWDNFLFWQDRANSNVAYNSDGTYKITGPCTTETGGAPSVNNPCTNTLTNPNSPQMNLKATPNSRFNGYIYQPRGSWLNLQGGGNLNGPLRIITGALNLGGGPNVTLTGVSTPITITETALIE